MYKRSTIVTIAQELGISPSTVSRAFDPGSRISTEVRSKILKCASEHNYIPNRAASRLSMREIKIGVAINDSYKYGVDEMLRGINAAYRSLYDYKLSIEVKKFDGRQIAEYCRETLEALNGCDGVIVCGFTSAEAVVELNRQAKVNPNLVLLQSDMEGVNRLFASVHDPVASAEIAAEFLECCLRMSGRKRVALFTGDRGLGVHSVARRAFTEAANSLGLDIIACNDMKDSEELLKKQAEQLVCEGAPDGIYITSGKSLELCRLVKALPQKERPILVTFDTYAELNDYIRGGTVTATIYQNMYNQAFNAFTLLVRHIVEGTEVQKVISAVPELVLRSNLRFYETMDENN